MVFSWGAITDDDGLLLALLTVGIVVAIGFEFGNGVDDDDCVGVSPVVDVGVDDFSDGVFVSEIFFRR